MLTKPAFDSHEVVVYDSPCIWDLEMEDHSQEESLITEICIAIIVKEKVFDEEETMKEDCARLDDEYYTIMESIANMIERCCFFE